MPEISGNDEKWMRYAINLAKKAWGETHPNPMVGSVLVDSEDRIIREGFHAKAGSFHAERVALTGLELAQEQKKTATLYVTLEPCCTHGRTPPCTEIILEKGIRRVVVGAIDPNPLHQSRGIELLRENGVEVHTGVLQHECEGINPIFHHWMRTGLPMIAVKTATTLDGKIATAYGKSQWITGPIARNHVMEWRRYFPAIAVGAGTALSDNPSLTVRKEDKVIACPKRLIFDRSLKTSSHIKELNVFNDGWKAQTYLVTKSSTPTQLLEPYREHGTSIIQLPYENDRFPLAAFQRACTELDIRGIYIEGGRSLISNLLAQNAIDYLFCYRAPKLFASDKAPAFADGLDIREPSGAPYIEQPYSEILGDDILSHGFLNYPQAE